MKHGSVGPDELPPGDRFAIGDRENPTGSVRLLDCQKNRVDKIVNIRGAADTASSVDQHSLAAVEPLNHRGAPA